MECWNTGECFIVNNVHHKLMDYETLKKEVEELKAWKANMEASSKIPLAVDQAFRARFANLGTILKVSAKGVDTEDVSVVDTDGGVINTYVVMNDPDGFLEVTIGATTYYIPYFT